MTYRRWSSKQCKVLFKALIAAVAFGLRSTLHWAPKRNSSDHRWGLLMSHFYSKHHRMSQTTITVPFTMWRTEYLPLVSLFQFAKKEICTTNGVTHPGAPKSAPHPLLIVRAQLSAPSELPLHIVVVMQQLPARDHLSEQGYLENGRSSAFTKALLLAPQVSCF